MQACGNGQHSLGSSCTYFAISGKFINHLIQRQRPEHVCVIRISTVLAAFHLRRPTCVPYMSKSFHLTNPCCVLEQKILFFLFHSRDWKGDFFFKKYFRSKAQCTKHLRLNLSNSLSAAWQGILPWWAARLTAQRLKVCVWTCVSSHSCGFLCVYVKIYRRFCDIKQLRPLV